MNRSPFINFIQANIPNVPIDEQSLQTIADQFEEKIFQKDDYLLKEGRISDYFFLAEGFIRVFTFDTEGNEVTTCFFSPNRVVFDAASFFLKLPSHENMQAMTRCVVYATSFEERYLKFIEVNKEVFQ